MSAPARSVIKAGCEALAGRDKALALAYEDCGVPEWRARVLDYRLLAQLVGHQQISLQAAASIWGRLEAYLGEVTAETMCAAPEAELQACGLSRSKITYMKSIAEATLGPLDLGTLAETSPEAAREKLLAVKGIGPWTAELVVLYALGAVDAFPSSDVGLMESYKRLSGADARLSVAGFKAQGEDWKPYRGVAVHLLWAWLHFDRARKKQAR